MRLTPVLNGQFVPARGGQGHRLLQSWDEVRHV